MLIYAIGKQGGHVDMDFQSTTGDNFTICEQEKSEVY